MAQLIVPTRKAIAISNGIFLMGIGLLYFTGFWWPGILLVIWATLATRQYLSNRNFDLTVSSVILIGLFIVFLFKFRNEVYIPILFFIGGIYIIVKEYFFGDNTDGGEKTEETKDDGDAK